MAWQPRQTPPRGAPSSSGFTRCCSPTRSKRKERNIMNESVAPFARPEIFRDPVTSGSFGVVEKPLSLWERVTNLGYVRKLVLLALLALIWEVYARWLNNPL